MTMRPFESDSEPVLEQARSSRRARICGFRDVAGRGAAGQEGCTEEHHLHAETLAHVFDDPPPPRPIPRAADCYALKLKISIDKD